LLVGRLNGLRSLVTHVGHIASLRQLYWRILTPRYRLLRLAIIQERPSLRHYTKRVVTHCHTEESATLAYAFNILNTIGYVVTVTPLPADAEEGVIGLVIDAAVITDAIG